MTPAIYKLNSVALVTMHIVNAYQRSNTVLATEGLPGSVNTSERFNDRGEWVNA